jgi:hypothetical protein
MQNIRYIYWQNGDFWLGHLEEYPDCLTQGTSLDDLKEHLLDLYKDLSSGVIPGVRSAAKPQSKELNHGFHEFRIPHQGRAQKRIGTEVNEGNEVESFLRFLLFSPCTLELNTVASLSAYGAAQFYHIEVPTDEVNAASELLRAFDDSTRAD